MLETDSTITGDYYQNNAQLTFNIKRYEPEANAMEAQKKLPYNHKDLIIKNDSVDIGGTLTWPKDEKADQMVIMISGSGAQDRDATMKPVSDFKPFAVLADSLTDAGIATFSYDDRGVDKSTGNFGNATLDILASDMNAIITDLTSRPNHNFKEILLLGHSQGGVVAGKVAAKNNSVDKLILMASTGVSLKEVVRFQVQQAFAPLNLDEAQEKYRQQFKAVQLAAGADSTQVSAVAQRQAAQLRATFSAPQTQSLLFYNPANDLKELDIPVLVLFGGKDTQVTVEMNKEPIEKVLESGNAKHQTEIFTAANHLFQKANTGQVQEYGSLENKFIEGFTTTIADWIKK